MNNIVKTNGELELIPFKEVEEKIIVVRGHEVLLDRDVAALYGVETKRINEAVRNNPRKFREGYMFELTSDESSVLRSKISTLELSEGKGRYSKYNFKAFTERGLYMLATILKSKRAEDATIAIIDHHSSLLTSDIRHQTSSFFLLPSNVPHTSALFS